jgi:hypothetical protein
MRSAQPVDGVSTSKIVHWSWRAIFPGRTAAYGRACFAWAAKRGTVHSNPFAQLPIPTGTTKRDRVLSDEEAAAIWRTAAEAPFPYGAIISALDANRPAPRRSCRHDVG